MSGTGLKGNSEIRGKQNSLFPKETSHCKLRNVNGNRILEKIEPEPGLLLVSTKNRDLWPSPTPEVRDSRTSLHAAHVQS